MLFPLLIRSWRANSCLRSIRLFARIRLGSWRNQLGLPCGTVESTIAQYNQAVQPGTFDLTRLDDCRTLGLAIEKTHWAQKIDTPPYLGYPLRPGITFTYLGVEVSAQARLKMKDGSTASNVFAAGEIMAGNILSKGYLGGFGMTIGTVFGRIAGREAARCRTMNLCFRKASAS